MPEKAGRSRQGECMRAIQGTASTKRRLPPRAPPRVRRPVRATRSHPRPLCICQHESSHPKLGSRASSDRNPDSQRAPVPCRSLRSSCPQRFMCWLSRQPVPVVAVRVTLHPVVGANVKTAVLLTDRAVGVAPWCSLAAGLRDGRTASVLPFYLFLPYFLLIYFLTLQYVASGASSGA